VAQDISSVKPPSKLRIKSVNVCWRNHQIQSDDSSDVESRALGSKTENGIESSAMFQTSTIQFHAILHVFKTSTDRVGAKNRIE
jgi:hypothetical protein